MNTPRMIRNLLIVGTLALPLLTPALSFAAAGDAAITQSVISALGSYKKGVSVKTKDGTVYLTGKVLDSGVRDEILARVQGVDGVQAVQDEGLSSSDTGDNSNSASHGGSRGGRGGSGRK